MVTSYKFCTLSDGRDVTAYKITNRFGEYAVLLDYGATIQSLCVLDRSDRLGDVVLGPDNGQSVEGARNMGSVMGRCGNRIAYGHFAIDGHDYQLITSRGPHHLHGAAGNFSKQIFRGEIGDECVTLRHTDVGEDGWGCTVEASITYSFGDNHALSIDYALHTDGDTVLSPTNHAYFNLDMPREIKDTTLRLFTDTYAPKSELGMPDGRICSVSGTPLDFSSPRSFENGFASDNCGFFKDGRIGYDDFYVMPGDGFRQVAEAVSPSSGRRMRVFSDAQSVILFTPSMREPAIGKGGCTLTGYAAFCIETQYVPNAVNCPEYRSPVFHTGETMHSRTVYAFDAI